MEVELLGAGRIAGVPASAISSHPGSRLVAVSGINAAAGKFALQYGARRFRPMRCWPIPHRRGAHRSLHRHAFRPDRTGGSGWQDGDLGKAGDDRVQPPVRPEFRHAESCGREGDRQPELLPITSFDPAPPPVSYIKVSGGLFRDMMFHDFDTVNFLMDAAPVSVTAVARWLMPMEGSRRSAPAAARSMAMSSGSNCSARPECYRRKTCRKAA